LIITLNEFNKFDSRALVKASDFNVFKLYPKDLEVLVIPKRLRLLHLIPMSQTSSQHLLATQT